MRHAEDDHARGTDVPEHERVDVAGVCIIIVRRNSHSPTVARHDTLLRADSFKPRAVFRADASHHGLDLTYEVREAHDIRKAATPNRLDGPAFRRSITVPGAGGDHDFVTMDLDAMANGAQSP